MRAAYRIGSQDARGRLWMDWAGGEGVRTADGLEAATRRMMTAAMAAVAAIVEVVEALR